MTTRERIQEAVADPEWQKFRLSMRSKPTATKLDMLEKYYDATARIIDNYITCPDSSLGEIEHLQENLKIQIDNYIKALCRGGQLEPGMTFDHFNDGSIWNHIRK